ncbi:uncharacterized protein EAF02_002315 [Botrytis sinoallii]|uniref:uncharacterized protein n=1 Tax=Botrytis sinoallii TaxID=1463999 RepID=UPI0018FF7158|nr:uncharacterized protein EAF02_002315 [Botrytis sinoallii]KAF7889900.1 hypothetical protein EAF02_002315 [Botrytis sinoallii]
MDDNPYQILEEPLKPASPRPEMLIVLPELIEQRRKGSKASVLTSRYTSIVVTNASRDLRLTKILPGSSHVVIRYPLFNSEQKNFESWGDYYLGHIKKSPWTFSIENFQSFNEKEAKDCQAINDPQWSLTWQVSSSMSSSTKPYTENFGHNGPCFGNLA